ncbi:MAG TPA: metallophosphatase domain-containing protein [Kofleriaceae bacterium]|jgi:predicted phosphohydrolase
MRIVAIADTHTFTDDFRVPDGDVLIHAGDMCRGGSLSELRTITAWLAAQPHRHKIVVAGNHDWCFVREPSAARSILAALGNAHYLEDSEVTLDGLRFYGSPWQPEFNNWAFNLPRGEALAAKWRQIPLGLDVLITHGPPAGMGDRSSYSGRAGCAELRVRVGEVAPRLHLFGHIHEDGGAWREGQTLYSNVTTWECERGASVFDIDASNVVASNIPPSGRDAFLSSAG